MSGLSLPEHRRMVVIGTVAGKLTKAIFGAFVVYFVYQAGLDVLAYALVFGGGGYALATTITDWRNGRKPWLPIERVPADEFRDTPYQRSAKVGTALGKLVTVILGAYIAYVLLQAGMNTLAYALVFGGGGYALVKTISEWRNGLRPWDPSKRVQQLD